MRYIIFKKLNSFTDILFSNFTLEEKEIFKLFSHRLQSNFLILDSSLHLTGRMR